MKLLEKEFVTNADKSGQHKFIQLRKEGDIALYRRETPEGLLIGFEVFRFKTIEKGAPLPGGGTVEETYESYPGGKSFGRGSAWFIGGVDCENRAMARFTELLTGQKAAVEPEGGEVEETPIVVKVVSAKPVKNGLKIPEGPFSQKELAVLNGFLGDDYKKVYSDLHKMLNTKVLKLAGKRDSARGKSAQLFEKNN